MARKKYNKPSQRTDADVTLTPEELKARLASEEAAIRKEKEAVIGAPVSEVEAQAMSRASANKILGISEQERMSYDALQALVNSGTVAKAMFGKKTTKKTEQESTESSTEDVTKEVVESLSAIASNIKEVVKSFDKMTAALQTAIDKKGLEEYKVEEAQAEAVPVSKERPTQTGETGNGKSTGDLLGDFFKNPAIIAAFSGLVYLFLPKDVKEKISGFFTGFTEGIKETSGELDTFKTALLVAAGGLATYLGVGVLKSVAEAITTTVSLIGKAKTFFKKMGPAGKVATAVVAGGAALAVGAAVSGKEEEETKERIPGATPEEMGPPPPKAVAEQKPGPAGTSTQKKVEGKLPESRSEARQGDNREPGGSGLKPQSKIGLQMPTGSDADIKKMIIHHEGIRYKPYKDSLGLWTVGVGHLIGDGRTLPPEYDRTFSHDEVMTMFDKDYEHHKAAAEKIPGYDKMNEKGEAALIDLTFNMGPAWYKKWPNFTRNLKEGNTEGAAESLEDSKWYTQVGRRAPTIVSLIRAGGEDNGAGQTGTVKASMAMGAPTVQGSPAASLEPPQPSSGTKVALASERNDAAMTPGQGSVINNSLSNNKQLTNKKGPDAPPPIPSPIADRGALGIGIRHSTSYV